LVKANASGITSTSSKDNSLFQGKSKYSKDKSSKRKHEYEDHKAGQ